MRYPILTRTWNLWCWRLIQETRVLVLGHHYVCQGRVLVWALLLSLVFCALISVVFWWKGGMLAIISASFIENTAGRHLFSKSLYWFFWNVGFRAATIYSVLLKHFCGLKLFPTCRPDTIGMSFTKWVWLIIHSSNLLSACRFFP